MRWAQLVVLLWAWWAVFAWHPQDDPPSYGVFGPFASQRECQDTARMLRLPPVFEFKGCVQVDIPGTGRRI